MTEVGAVMSEGNALSTTTAISTSVAANISPAAEQSGEIDSSTLAIAKSSEDLKGDQANGNNTKKNDDFDEPMDVDGCVDTEEDDSQITSSTENGVGGGRESATIDGGDSKISADDISKRNASPPTISAENSKESEDPIAITEKDTVRKDSSRVNENSLNAFADGDSQNSSNDKTAEEEEESQDSISGNSAKHTLLKEEDSSSQSHPPPQQMVDSNGDTDGDLSQNSGKEVAIDGIEPRDISQAVTQKSDAQKENGVASIAERAVAAEGVVDLGDDSDEDSAPVAVPKKDQTHVDSTSNGEAEGNAKTTAAPRSVCSDSDGAVVIGSDSESENIAASAPPPLAPMSLAPQSKAPAPKQDSQLIDDDDDDCVVIEDDTPAPPPNDLTKRKSLALDSPNHSDDSQPPSKRQRSIAPSAPVNQLTIKDARSLMPQEATVKKADIYPINITSAPNAPQPGPPKLVPVTNPLGMPMPGLANSNANLLPGLTDDMFVLEAPSFIVPYIYEKPPVDILKDIVQDIETKYKLTKEDLAEADKSDEFDMMTEQNKDEKEEKEKNGKKKKKRGDADDSWSEESDEDDDDDDDDDSEAGMRTKVLIKEASDDLAVLKGAIKPASAVVAQTVVAANTTVSKPGQENYFESPLGKFFMDIGVGQVQEFVQSDLIRLQKRKMRKSLGKNITEFERAIAALSGNLEASKKKNAAFKFTMKRCEFCNFKSESALAMANHYETPHMNGPLYKCNFCTFEIRNATEIVYHMEAMHNIKARLIKPLPYHQCPNCGFEDNGKAKLARHQPVCAKKFRPELNLAPPNDWEAPAKIPRIKPRHGLVGTATAYQAMAAQAAAQKAALASIQAQQQQAAQARSMQAAALAAQNAANKLRGRAPQLPKPGPVPGAMLRGPSQVRSPMATNVVMPNNYQLGVGSQLIQSANAMAKKTLSGQPSISITPLPRQSAAPQLSSPSTSKMPPAGMKPGQSPTAGGGNNKAQFVICEICDGYIKDLEQLRNHMQWMHKVKIHPKMIYNRPPLNCQKCQFRFFTDQGLERHLLGSHGLVTSSMQEAANKGKDAGRCPVCGRMYQWKLLNHVSRDHHMTLKPAHLSYKCTVCTATFGMYKQFETHVYTAHSTVAKKAMDGKKNNAPGNAGLSAAASGSQRSSLGMTNDSLLKPLKINDEITIIPQPASKPRITNMESHVID